VHRLAGGRVGPLARVAVGDGELAEAGDGDVLAGGQTVPMAAMVAPSASLAWPLLRPERSAI
jgi:hypothetical protein